MLDDNLFLLIPNNSGSTFIYKSICNSKHVSYLPSEGQFVNGFIGTKPAMHNYQFIWAGTDFIRDIGDTRLHDWAQNKKVWKKRAINFNTNNIFVEKSPPNIAKAEMLIKNFTNVKFIISIRNPYAVFESILRARTTSPVNDTIIASHIINTMLIQKRNITNINSDNYIFFKYEELCSNPINIAASIASFVPKLDDVSFSHRINVKNRYNSVANNYNDEQISRLPCSSINAFNLELDKSKNNDIMSFFNYDRI